MSKSSVVSAPKIPASQLSSKSAWAKGPPQTASPRSQSPAPSSPAPVQATHSRRPSTLGQGIPIKDGVSIPRNNVGATKTGSVVSFGSIDDASAPISSSPAATPAIKASAESVKSFGSVPATPSQMNGKSSFSSSTKPPLSQTSSSNSVSAASTTSSSTSAPAKPGKMDIRKLFQNPSSLPSTSQSPSDTNSPSLRAGNLPSQPQPSTSTGAPPFTPFVPGGMRPPPNSTGPGVPPTPRSPNYPRQQMPNGNGPRPPNGVNASGPPMQPPMGSPRLAPHPHPGQQPNMQPQQMPPVQMGWSGYYYGMPPGMPPDQSYMYAPPPPWAYGMPPQQMPPHPQQHPPLPHHPSSQGPPHQMPMSPRNPPPALQSGPPGTPTPSHATATPHSPHPTPLTHSSSGSISGVSSPPPTPSSASMPGRLNTNATAFVPRPSSKIIIKSAIDGPEVTLENLKKSQSHQSSPSTVTSPPLTSSPSGLNSPSRRAIRIEDPEAKRKRQEKEKEEAQAKLAAAEKERKAKEEEEKKAKEAKEKEEERIKKEKEEAERKEKEEAERKVKEEAERKAKEEAERKAKEEEEERQRLKAEEEERQRIKAEEEEKQRLAEEERIRKEKLKLEAEEKLRREKEEEERKKEEEQARLRKEEEAAAAAARAKAEEESKAESKIEEQEEGEVIESDKPAVDDQEGQVIESKPEEKKSLRIDTTPLVPEHQTRRRPGPLDLSVASKPNIPAPLPSALATARIIDDLSRVPYPEGVRSPQIELNVNAKDSKFRYDRDFLLQFMSICKEKPDNLPALDAIGLESSNQSFPMVRSQSGRGSRPGPNMIRSSSVNMTGSNLKAGASNFSGMGNFGTPGSSSKLTSEERFHISNRTVSMGSAGAPFGRPGIQRTASTGGPSGSQLHPGRTRSKRGDKRPDANKAPAAPNHQQHNQVAFGPGGVPLEPVAPLQQSENRWDRKAVSNIDPESPEIVDRKVKALLNKLTMEKFDSISDQIIGWANKSETQKDGRTLIQVIRLVFEKATDEAAWSEMYARLCRKMMEQISPKVQDDGIKNAEGKPIAGGHLFRKYLLNRCQEDFERGWVNKEATAAAAATKASEDQAVKAANGSKEEEEIALYSDEYYTAQKAKRQGLGLIKFIGELFKLQMLTERIMHECVKKLLGNVENPEEEEIESLCKLLTTVGQMLDTNKARAHMDVYFSRMKELTKSPNVSSRMQFMLQDIIELRERKWQSRNAVAAPTTIAKIHEAAAKEKAAQEKESYNRMAMSRGGSRRGGERSEQPNADGWTTTAPRPPAKVGDLSKFGQINKSAPMTFGPSSVFAGKKDSKRESLSRTNSSANMFQMLQNVDAADAATTKTSRPPSRKASVDLGQGGVPEPAPQRKRLVLQPRTKPVDQDSTAPAQEESGSDSDEEVTDEPEQEMSKEEAKKKIAEDTKEFFGVRNLDEAEIYFSKLPSSYHHMLVDKLVSSAIESKEADATLVGDFFLRASSKKLCSSSAFEEGFLAIAEFLDDIAIDAPKATNLFAVMIKGAELSEEQRTNISSKSAENGDKLLKLSS